MDFRDPLVVTYYYTDAYVGKARKYMEKFSVKKPFTILVMVVAIIILGFVSLSGMTTDLLPKMSLPYLLVITTYPGASPEKVVQCERTCGKRIGLHFRCKECIQYVL